MDREMRELRRGYRNEQRRLTPDPEPMPDNQPIINDVGALREELPDPDDRPYTLVSRKDHIRVVYDDDIAMTAGDPTPQLQERGYKYRGANFGSKTVVFVPEDDA